MATGRQRLRRANFLRDAVPYLHWAQRLRQSDDLVGYMYESEDTSNWRACEFAASVTLDGLPGGRWPRKPSWCGNERHGRQPHVNNGKCDTPKRKARP